MSSIFHVPIGHIWKNVYSIYFLLSSLWSKLGIQLGLNKQKSQTIYSRINQSSQVPTETYWVKLSMLRTPNPHVNKVWGGFHHTLKFD